MCHLQQSAHLHVVQLPPTLCHQRRSPLPLLSCSTCTCAAGNLWALPNFPGHMCIACRLLAMATAQRPLLLRLAGCPPLAWPTTAPALAWPTTAPSVACLPPLVWPTTAPPLTWPTMAPSPPLAWPTTAPSLACLPPLAWPTTGPPLAQSPGALLSRVTRWPLTTHQAPASTQLYLTASPAARLQEIGVWQQAPSLGPAPTKVALAWARALGQHWVAIMWRCLAPTQVGILLQCMQTHIPSPHHCAPGCCRHESASFWGCSGPSRSCWQPWHNGMIMREHPHPCNRKPAVFLQMYMTIKNLFIQGFGIVALPSNEEPS